MRKAQKKQKRANMAQFKTNLLGAKCPKNHPLNHDKDEEELAPAQVLDYKGLLQERARVRKARFDRWRNGRKSRGVMRLYGYATDPHAVQAKLAIKTSRQAFTFKEPELPYWMVPDEDEEDEAEAHDDQKDPETTKREQEAREAILLEPLKMIHGDIVLTTPWEICLYVDTLLQAGSKVIKNRHTTANRGAAPYFPSVPAERQQCMLFLRKLHTFLVVPFWNLVEQKEDEDTNRSLIATAVTKIEELLASSTTTYAFGMKKPGVLEQWAAPLFQRLQRLNLYTPTEGIATWVNHSLGNDMEGEEGSSSSSSGSGSSAVEAEFHKSNRGKRPQWVDAVNVDSVWQ